MLQPYHYIAYIHIFREQQHRLVATQRCPRKIHSSNHIHVVAILHKVNRRAPTVVRFTSLTVNHTRFRKRILITRIKIYLQSLLLL
jgi:hypothetical protein